MASYATEYRAAASRHDEGDDLVEADARWALDGGGTSSGPEITNVSPASGSALSPGDTLTFDLTDPDGTSDLSEFYVLVKMPAAWEVAYDLGAESFGPAYGGSRTSIADGYTFTVYRREGWRTPLSVVCMPRDAAGGTSS